MKRIIILVIFITFLTVPVTAEAFTAPAIPEAGEKYMPPDTESFAEGVWHIVKSALADLQPGMVASARNCLSVFAIVLLVSVIRTFPTNIENVINFAGAAGIGIVLLEPTSTLIHLGVETVHNISEYGKLLIPVLTAALAAQGGIQASTAMYAITTGFCALLSTLIAKLLIPLIYIFLCLSVSGWALGHSTLQNLRSLIKQVSVSTLKTILYLFTGFLSVTGVVSGATDASVLKAAKLTISGFVPVVGGILSDASEAVIVGTTVMKNAAGVYGLLAIVSVWIGPFLQIGVQYLLVKLTSGLCNIFGAKEISSLVQDFSGAMGLILAMTATITIMLLISIVCFMRGVA